MYPHTKFKTNMMNGFREKTEDQTLNTTPKRRFQQLNVNTSKLTIIPMKKNKSVTPHCIAYVEIYLIYPIISLKAI